MVPCLCDVTSFNHSWLVRPKVFETITRSLLSCCVELHAIGGGCTFGEERARGAGEADEGSRFLLFVFTVLRGSFWPAEVLPRGRPLRPDDRCCCSESDVDVGAGVVGSSGLTLSGRAARLLGGS